MVNDGGLQKVCDEGGAIDHPWDGLVVSILAVNQYSLERTFAVVGGLRAAKLTDPENLMHWTLGDMAEKLKSAGCKRGAFMTTLFARRLCALGEFIRKNGAAQCEAILSSGDRESIARLLLPVHGIGPKVLKNFFLLHGLDTDAAG